MKLLPFLLCLFFLSSALTQEVIYFDQAANKKVDKADALDSNLYKIVSTTKDTLYQRTTSINLNSTAYIKTWPTGQDSKKRYTAQIEVKFVRNSFIFDFDTLDKRQRSTNIHSISSSSLRVSTLRDTFHITGGASLGATLRNVKNRGNCDFKATFLRIVDSIFVQSVVTSLQELEDNDRMRVFPNPTSNILHLPLRYNDSATEIEVYDLKGNLVVRTKSKNHIDVSTLNEGIYFLKSKNFNAKFIKN